MLAVGTERRRAANEFRARVFGGDDERVIAFICECGHHSCHRTVMLTLRQYGRARPGPIVDPEHESRHSDEDLVEYAS